jgi:hypothetical protein
MSNAIKPEFLKAMNGMIKAIALIHAKEGKKVMVQGEISCSECGKALRYSVMSNGHIHAKCESGDIVFSQ